jgi:hypothetical protein
VTQRTAGAGDMTQTEVTVLPLAVVLPPSDGHAGTVTTQACKIIQVTRWNRARAVRSESAGAGPNRTPGCRCLRLPSPGDSESESACTGTAVAASESGWD